MIGKETMSIPTPADVANKSTPPAAPPAPPAPDADDTPTATPGVDFPTETRRADMDDEQKSAYDRYQAAKNSRAAKKHAKAAADAEERAAEAERQLEQLRRQQLPEDERKAAEGIEAEVARRVQAETERLLAAEAEKRRERARASLPAEIRRLNPAFSADDAEQHAEMLNLDKLLTEDGYLDTEAVSKAALPGIVIGGSSHRQAYESVRGSTPPGPTDIETEVAKRTAEKAAARAARS